MAAPTSVAEALKKTLANGGPSTQGRFVPFAKPSTNGRYLRERDNWVERKAEVATGLLTIRRCKNRPSLTAGCKAAIGQAPVGAWIPPSVSPAIRLPLRKPLRAMRPRLEQRLSLVDFGHFRSRRKAIEGWPENGAGFSGAAGRLVELGE